MWLLAWSYNKGGGAAWLISKANSVILEFVDFGLDDWPIEMKKLAGVTLDGQLSLLMTGQLAGRLAGH